MQNPPGRSRNWAWACSVCLAFLATESVGQSLSPEATSQVLEVATAICGDYVNSGSSSQQEIAANVEGHLKGLTKFLAEAGAEGTYSFKSDEYVNVARAELSGEMSGVRNCKMAVWNDLKADILQGSAN